MNKLLIVSGVLVVSSLTAAAFANYQVVQLNESMTQLQSKLEIEHLLSENAPVINRHISERIAAYIDNERKKVAEVKYENYKHAAAKLSDPDKRIYGSEKARFTLVEFSDSECPYCKKYHSTPKQLVDAAGGLINWEWKHMPLSFHNPSALQSSVAAECANEIGGNQAFWVYMQSVFDNTKGNGQGPENLANLAFELGLDTTAFAKCLNDPKHLEKIQADMGQAESLGVNSTPVTYIVDNRTGKKILMKGLVQPVALVSAIQKLKKESSDVSTSETNLKETKG